MIGDLPIEQLRTGGGVERYEVRVQRGHVEPLSQHRDSPTLLAATQRQRLGQIVLVGPEDVAGRRVEGIHLVFRGGQIHDAVETTSGVVCT